MFLVSCYEVVVGYFMKTFGYTHYSLYNIPLSGFHIFKVIFVSSIDSIQYVSIGQHSKENHLH